MKIKIFSFITAFTFVISVQAQTATPSGAAATVDQTSTSDASNQGVALNAGGNTSNSKQISVLFPPTVQAGLSSESNCILHGTESYAGGWNFISWSKPVHDFNKECALQKTIDRFAALCQYNTVKRLLDKFVSDTYKIKPEDAYRAPEGASMTYEQYLNANFKDLTYKECAESKTVPPTEVKTVEKKVEVPGPVREVVVPGKDKETKTTTKSVDLASDVFFSTGKHALTGTGRVALMDAMSKFGKTKDSVSSVEGHTDNRGSDKYNMELSLRRANEVAAELKSLGFGVGNVKGSGYHKPADTNATAEGRTRNRRVTLQISTQETTEVVNVK
jgi:outer membrane protein OmpA-like peptidoglycan-associated protein